MNKEVFFFDTYAFFEVIRGNPKYEKYKEVIVITTIFNLAELNYGLKKEFSEDIADSYVERYAPFLVDINIEDIKKAMSFKIKNKKMSIPDVVGYIIARKFNVKILTGDEDFRNLDNVEFVK